jgi:hypothetical protein
MIIARHNKIEMVRNSVLANDSDACSNLGDILDSKFNDSFSLMRSRAASLCVLSMGSFDAWIYK